MYRERGLRIEEDRSPPPPFPKDAGTSVREVKVFQVHTGDLCDARTCGAHEAQNGCIAKVGELSSRLRILDHVDEILVADHVGHETLSRWRRWRGEAFMWIRGLVLGRIPREEALNPLRIRADRRGRVPIAAQGGVDSGAGLGVGVELVRAGCPPARIQIQNWRRSSRCTSS